MKRTISLILIFTLTIISSLSLFSCESATGVMLYHETFDRMQGELPFTMKTVPELENVVIYGSMDEKLGEIRYTISNEGERMNGTLIFRMAETAYAKEVFSDNTPGIAGIEAAEASHTEGIGSYQISYYVTGSTVFAVWGDESYSYSISFTFTDTAETPVYEDIKPHVIAVISTKY